MVSAVGLHSNKVILLFGRDCVISFIWPISIQHQGHKTEVYFFISSGRFRTSTLLSFSLTCRLCVPMFFFNLSVRKTKRLFVFFGGKKEKDRTMIFFFFFLFCLGGQIEPPYYLLLTDQYQRKSTVLHGINHHFLVYKPRCHFSILFYIEREKWRVEVVSIGGR